MSFIGSLARSVINPMSLAQVAMGPAGWASIAMRTIGSQVAMNAIQRLGQQMGLPSAMIDVAQATFARSAGLPGLAFQNANEAASQLASQFGLNPREEAQVFNAATKGMDAVNRILDRIARRAAEEEGDTAANTSGKGSVLMRIARALGKVMDDKMNAMAAKGDQLGKLGNSGALTKDGNFNAKGQSQYGMLTSEMQALGQELSMVSQAVANTLKSVGEAGATLARK